MSEKKYSYDHPMQSLTVDIAVFGYNAGKLSLLLIKRGVEPFIGRYALPGGFVQQDESLEVAALRELHEETSIEVSHLEQIQAFGNPSRDPRGRVVSVAFLALIKNENVHPIADTDAESAEWHSIADIQDIMIKIRNGEENPFAFDHLDIIDAAIRRLKNNIDNEPIAFQVLPEEFTLHELQLLHETVLGSKLERANFRKKVTTQWPLLKLDKKARSGSRGPAADLYKIA
jgi:8-oxo-dGTP diphosphatase